jgi:uncharacterized membrane protein
VSTYEVLLFLHVLSAFALVSAQVLFSFLIAALWRSDVPAEIDRVAGISRFGSGLIGVGSVGVLIFGIALAFQADSYAIWDGWIVAALVLWAVLGAVGQRVGKAYDEVGRQARELVAAGNVGPNRELGLAFRSEKALGLHLASVAVFVLLLLDMMFKPGA